MKNEKIRSRGEEFSTISVSSNLSRKASQEAFKGHWSLPTYLHLVRAHYGLPATSLHLHRHMYSSWNRPCQIISGEERSKDKSNTDVFQYA